MNNMKRLVLPLLLAIAATHPSVAADYPTRPIKIIVPFGTGGVSDTTARITARAIEKALGQPVVVENKPGGDGAIAAMTVKTSSPDGHTLFYATSSTLATPLVSRAAQYDAVRDFAPISTMGKFPYGMFVHKDVPATTVEEFIAHARANPGRLNYGTVNNGEYLAGSQFLKAAGIDAVRVPYKTAPMIDLVAGRIQFYFGPVANVISHVRDGKVRMLAMFSNERSPLAPDVPTLSEAGFDRNVGLPSYQMLLAPAGTPPAVTDRLSREVNVALRDPEVRAQLEKIALQVEGMTPQQLRTSLESANRTWTEFFREAGIEPQ
jgi:tripartite-type tricarboxylate transporter receptor subunit TctC